MVGVADAIGGGKMRRDGSERRRGQARREWSGESGGGGGVFIEYKLRIQHHFPTSRSGADEYSCNSKILFVKVDLSCNGLGDGAMAHFIGWLRRQPVTVQVFKVSRFYRKLCPNSDPTLHRGTVSQHFHSISYSVFGTLTADYIY